MYEVRGRVIDIYIIFLHLTITVKIKVYTLRNIDDLKLNKYNRFL